MKEPNWRDPRTIARVKKIITDLSRWRNTDKIYWGHKMLSKHIGTANTSIGHFMRQHLMIRVRGHNTWDNTTAIWRINNQVWPFLLAVIDNSVICWQDWVQQQSTQPQVVSTPTPTRPILTVEDLLVIADVDKRYSRQIKTGDFIYKQVHNNPRRYHPLQQVKNVARHELFAQYGYTHNYDICCAMATIITQKAKQIDQSLDVPVLTDYVTNRQAWRTRLAQVTGRSIDDVKQMIQSTISGGQVRADEYSQVGQELKLTYQEVDAYNNDPMIKSLKQDLRLVWRCLKNIIRPIPKYDSRGRNARLTPRERMNFYFQEEARVLSTIDRVLSNDRSFTGLRYFLEHDGFRCDQQVDTQLLVDEVRMDTGYELMYDYEVVIPIEVSVDTDTDIVV